MKNKFLSKIVMVALIISSMFIISACDIFQKDINIAKIEVKEGTIPESIKVGEFDNAGIKLVLTYDDNSTEEIAVTSEMIPEEYQSYLTTPGIYEIQILFRGLTTDITIKIVESTNVYTVKFFNSEGNIISTQSISHGEDAIAPSVDNTNVEGFEFVTWDKAYTNITADTNIYAISVNVESILTNEEILNRLENAINNTKTLSHQATVIYKDTSITDEKENSKMFIDYEYTSAENVNVSIKGLNYQNNEYYWANINNGVLTEKLLNGDSIDGLSALINYDYFNSYPYDQSNPAEYIYNTENSITLDRIAELSYILSIDEFENLITNLTSINYSIKLTANTYYYTIELEVEDDNVNHKYIFEFNDDRMINVQRLTRSKNSDTNFLTIEKIYDYSNVQVEDFDIVLN